MGSFFVFLIRSKHETNNQRLYKCFGANTNIGLNPAGILRTGILVDHRPGVADETRVHFVIQKKGARKRRRGLLVKNYAPYCITCHPMMAFFLVLCRPTILSYLYKLLPPQALKILSSPFALCHNGTICASGGNV